VQPRKASPESKAKHRVQKTLNARTKKKAHEKRENENTSRKGWRKAYFLFDGAHTLSRTYQQTRQQNEDQRTRRSCGKAKVV
jgi:hypothetical protein